MTTSAAEVFVVQLARASRKAKRIVRFLPKADRDDIIAAALLWCWEHRDSYSLTTSLDTWFVNAVRDSYKQWRRGALRNATEQLDEIPTGDTTSAAAEALEAMDRTIAALTPIDRRVAHMLMLGRTRAEMMREGLSHDEIYKARQRIRQLRRLVPDEREYKRAMRAGHPDFNSDSVGTDIVNSYNRRSNIDLEIEQLEAMPHHGADCPPCWLCKYFDGYLPSAYRRVRMEIQEADVSAAIANTEAEKIRIANEVRHGTL